MEWISVDDKLPEEDSRVLVLYEDGWIDIDIYISGGEWTRGNCLPFADQYEVTHWMELPEAPKEETT